MESLLVTRADFPHHFDESPLKQEKHLKIHSRILPSAVQ